MGCNFAYLIFFDMYFADTKLLLQINHTVQVQKLGELPSVGVYTW